MRLRAGQPSVVREPSAPSVAGVPLEPRVPWELEAVLAGAVAGPGERRVEPAVQRAVRAAEPGRAQEAAVSAQAADRRCVGAEQAREREEWVEAVRASAQAQEQVQRRVH